MSPSATASEPMKGPSTPHTLAYGRTPPWPFRRERRYGINFGLVDPITSFSTEEGQGEDEHRQVGVGGAGDQARAGNGSDAGAREGGDDGRGGRQDDHE